MNKEIMNNWKHIDIYPNIILAEHETTEHEKSMWIWDNDSTLFDGDTLIRIDLHDNKITYMHFCLAENWKMVIDEIRKMGYVNTELLSELTNNNY